MRAALGVPDQDLDPHIWAIQAMLLDDAHTWSVPVGQDPKIRAAVSSPTPYLPIAVRVVFAIEGDTIELLAISRR
jgi:hypothetical protein